MMGILRGLEALHDQGVLHRDIKLDNILLDDNLCPKICDFGVSWFMKEGKVIKEKCGTPAYLAPEIIKGEGYEGFKIDIWSLGVLFYFLISQRMPFKADSIENLHKVILEEEPDYFYKCFSKDSLDLLKKMLNKDPRERINL